MIEIYQHLKYKIIEIDMFEKCRSLTMIQVLNAEHLLTVKIPDKYIFHQANVHVSAIKLWEVNYFVGLCSSHFTDQILSTELKDLLRKTGLRRLNICFKFY